MPKAAEPMMNIDVSTPICDLDGRPLPIDGTEGAPAMKLGHVLIRVALQPPMEGAKPYTAAQQTVRYNIAMDIHVAMATPPHTVEMEPAVVREMSEEVARFFAPVIAGPAIRAMTAK